jgi:hypothetical protein
MNHDGRRSRTGATARRFLAAAALFATTGCYKVTVIDDRVPPTEDPTHEEWTDFFIFGLVGTEEFDVRAYCSGPASEVRTGGNVGTVVVSALTLGIYTPRKVYIHCPTGAVTLTPPVASPAPSTYSTVPPSGGQP